MKKRNLYLETIPVDEAVNKYLTGLEGLIETKTEKIKVTESLGRVTNKAVFAKYSSPLFNASAMDGIGAIAEKTSGATEIKPVILKEKEDFIHVDTGDPIHAPYNSVIMAEDIVETEDGVKIIEGAAPWQHIRPIGEDIVAGEMIIPSKHKIRSIDIGVLLSAGITEVQAIKRPTVAIFPTGTEIIEPEEEIEDGSIIESNSRMFENMVVEEGGIAHRFKTIVDDYDKIKEAVKKAVHDFDMVIINAGSSAGRDDYTVHVLRELGEVLVHGVAIKPGKPVILAIVEGKPVIGLPGYPVSAYIGFENFVSPVLAKMSGENLKSLKKIKAVISKRIVSSLKHKEYVRVKVGKVGEKMVAAPLARGAGAAMSLVRADGFCVIEQNSEGIDGGEEVYVELYTEKENIENTVVAIGSHDLILDVLADIMPNMKKGQFVSSTHVGSLAGLMALKRGEAHIAPIHILHEKTGQYNIDIINSMFPDGHVSLIKGVGRTQGIMVKKGNPLNIKSIEDLKGCRFINRQRGAGTRILLDYTIKTKGITPEEIDGYDREATTHMAVAAAVGSDGADAGMGIFSAAKAMGLDFIPIAEEEYDFAVPKEFVETPLIKNFIEAMKSQEFKDQLEELGGYKLI